MIKIGYARVNEKEIEDIMWCGTSIKIYWKCGGYSHIPAKLKDYERLYKKIKGSEE